jgi:hypothetical protein
MKMGTVGGLGGHGKFTWAWEWRISLSSGLLFCKICLDISQSPNDFHEGELCLNNYDTTKLGNAGGFPMGTDLFL